MVRLGLILLINLFVVSETSAPINPSTPVRRPQPLQNQGRWTWLTDPRSAVLLSLGSVLVIGGGRKWWKTIQARRAVARLADPDATVHDIAEAAAHGREGLIELFRLLGTASDPLHRDAACRAIASLWSADNLIAEEEKALIRRGYVVNWKARRRYPRGLSVPIPIHIEFGVPALRVATGEVGPDNLLWSYRIIGSQRASLETFTPWIGGQGHANFEINPSDFLTNGPHRLVLESKVKTTGLTDPWELELPHVPFNFELDPRLDVDALLTMPDESRGELIAKRVQLVSEPPSEGGSRFVMLTDDLVLRDPPQIEIATPMPCDLAHNIQFEFENVSGLFSGGDVILSGQGVDSTPKMVAYPLQIKSMLPLGSIEHAGEIRIRATLTADPQRGWADPEVRSIWPGTITTNWEVARIVRR